MGSITRYYEPKYWSIRLTEKKDNVKYLLVEVGEIDDYHTDPLLKWMSVNKFKDKTKGVVFKDSKTSCILERFEKQGIPYKYPLL